LRPLDEAATAKDRRKIATCPSTVLISKRIAAALLFYHEKIRVMVGRLIHGEADAKLTFLGSGRNGYGFEVFGRGGGQEIVVIAGFLRVS